MAYRWDRNTQYFHAHVSQIKKANFISSLEDDNGNMMTNLATLQFLSFGYVFHTFTSKIVNSDANLFVESMVSLGMNKEPLAPFNTEEVKHALFQMNPLKSPGPDDMYIVGSDVCEFVLNMLCNNWIDIQFNFTHITLIPKTNTPNHIAHVCSIGLCNIIYKILAKCIRNRFQRVMDLGISKNQSSFVA